MKPTSLTFRITALVGLLVFITVQFFLIYNAYRVNLEHFFTKEKDIINREYSKAIINDRLFPGGQAIIDTIYLKNRDKLDSLYQNNKKEFSRNSRLMMDSIIDSLRKGNTIKPILDSIVKIKYKLANNYKYALILKEFDISFKKNQYTQLFPYENLNPNKQIIGGNLSGIYPSDLVTSLSISSPNDKSNRIIFQLYIQASNKTWTILKTMTPTFLLSLASMVTIVSLFFITVNNWFKQKKLAEMQTDFINSISHEFNTPLTAIIIANKTLQNEKMIPQSEKLKSITDIVQRQTTRLNSLFKQTLNITKANKSFVNKQQENIVPLIEKIVNDYKTNLNESTSVEFDTNISSDLRIRIDTFWFTTMLQNIMDNGIKYNRNPMKTIEINLSCQGGNILLSIKDNGIGMSSNTIKNIFNKFYRHNNKSSQEGGLGLGLFYVRECIKLHNWEINVESELGIGSEFIVTLR